MRGIILAGGLGTRLHPLTKVTNKCLLPVYDRPMIYWPIQSLVESGIKDILLVCGGNAAGEFLRILGNGEEFGLKHIAYTYQDKPLGIAHALGLAEEWANNEPICVVLADNILENSFKDAADEFRANPDGARIFVTENEHPEWYGVAELDENGNILSLVEKSKEPKTNLVVIGVYMYDATVWDYIRSLKPSKRNELEITDLNNNYLSIGKLKAYKLEGGWKDAGESLEVYNDTCNKVREWKRKK